MPTARATLAAEHREVPARRSPASAAPAGCPAVVYGHGVDSTSVSIDAHDFEQLRRHIGPNALVDLSVDGKKAQPGPRLGGPGPPGQPPDPPRRPVPGPDDRGADGRRAARRDRRVARGRQLQGGTLLHPIESVRVRALPDHLPQSIEYSVESLVDFDTTIHVRDLVDPERRDAADRR